MNQLLACTFALVLACGCGGDAFSAGPGTAGAGGRGAEGGRPSAGGSDQAGKATGGDTSQGNTGSGGEEDGTGSGATGATGTAGTDAGGSSTAGMDAGGSSGSSGGGVPGGGTDSGGTDSGGMSMGGLAGGGASSTTTCQVDEDCVACAYDRVPKTALNCYCVGCPDVPMNVTSCQANQKQYDKVCALADLTCAPIKCDQPEPVHCVKGRCQNAQ